MAKVFFLIQMPPALDGGCCNQVYFQDIRLKILRLPIFYIALSACANKILKSEPFSCLPKVDHVIKSCKEPIALFQVANVLTIIKMITKV